MELWSEIRRRVLTGDISLRQACSEYHLNFRTVRKIVRHAEPPPFHSAAPRPKPALFRPPRPFTNARFACLFPRECTETFHEGHARAFDFFGGVATRLSYDNSRIAVVKLTGAHERRLTKEFLLQAHFAFAAHF